jgi:hypothetical protein
MMVSMLERMMTRSVSGMTTGMMMVIMVILTTTMMMTMMMLVITLMMIIMMVVMIIMSKGLAQYASCLFCNPVYSMNVPNMGTS